SAVIFLMPGTPNGTITVSSGTGTATSAGSYTVTATPYPYYQQGSKRVGTGATGAAQQGTDIAVSADGNTAIVGGPTDNSSVGAAWIYVRNGSTWSQQGGKLVGTGATGAAKQGTSVAISADGNTAVLGGPTDNMGAGAVWVFTRNGTTWSQQGSKLTGSGAVGAAQQGTSVSVSANGNTIAVGGLGDNSFAGATWIFTRNGTAWSQQGGKLVGTGAVGAARQGCAVSLSSDGNTLISGGYNDATRQGAAWVFTQSGGVWTQQGAKLVGSGASSDSYQGWSVALSANGNTAAIGGTNDNTLKGAVWIFTRSSGVWSQQGNKLVGTGAVGNARQGGSVAVSADGNTLVEGGYGDDSNKGAMWVFTRSGSSWTQQGSKVTGTGASGASKQGTSIALSSTGTTAALGGPTDASNAGAAWIFFSSVSFMPTKADTREEEPAVVLHEFTLGQNTPNPFAGRTNIGFSLPASCMAEWQIMDVSGRVVLSLKREYPAGENTEVFDMSAYSGVYWYTLKTPFGVKTGKMAILK
ncbi:MAG: T9SS type A sorting domain-containing protein, partial [Bacteroidota bacterium]